STSSVVALRPLQRLIWCPRCLGALATNEPGRPTGFRFSVARTEVARACPLRKAPHVEEQETSVHGSRHGRTSFQPFLEPAFDPLVSCLPGPRGAGRGNGGGPAGTARPLRRGGVPLPARRPPGRRGGGGTVPGVCPALAPRRLPPGHSRGRPVPRL